MQRQKKGHGLLVRSIRSLYDCWLGKWWSSRTCVLQDEDPRPKHQPYMANELLDESIEPSSLSTTLESPGSARFNISISFHSRFMALTKLGVVYHMRPDFDHPPNSRTPTSKCMPVSLEKCLLVKSHPASIIPF